jgi:hypothetical protein
MYYSGYIQTHCHKNKKIKRADQILPEVYGTTLRGKQDWTIHRYTGHKTHSEDKQNKEKHNTEIQKDELHRHPTKNVDEPRCSRRVIISYFA